MRQACLRSFFALAILLATACGGGGGGNDSAASITAGSAPAIAGAALRGLSFSSEMSELALDFLPATPPGPAGMDTPLRPPPPDTATRAPIGPDTDPCPADGDVTYTGDIADAMLMAYAAGDFVNADFDMCDLGGGDIIHGLLEMAIAALAGDIMGAFTATFDIVMTDLSVTLGGETLVFDGDGMLDVDTTVANVLDAQLDGSSFTVDDSGDAFTLLDYLTVYRLDDNVMPAEYTLDGMGRLTSAAFGGEVSYEVTEDFVGSGMGYPNDGTLKVVGAENATMWVIADPNAIDLDIEIDLNGDGSVDALVETTWDAL